VKRERKADKPSGESLPLTSHLSLLTQRWKTRSLIIGATAALLSILGALLDRRQFFRSYLFAWLFWGGLPLGALVILMMQFLTGGIWGMAVRHFSLAALRTLPLMALLFLPVLLGLPQIYRWANGEASDSAGYHHKAQYLNAPFFIARFLFYFAVLFLIAHLLRKWSVAAAWKKVGALSAGGLIIYVLCMNFASTDWIMSLDPQWYSTIFVEVFASGQFLSALALMTMLFCLFGEGSLEAELRPKALHDLGNLLLSFVIFWTYVSFSQLLIIWSGNLPKEISWYLDRSRGGWQWFALTLSIFQFLLPFFLLLSRDAKRNPRRLFTICLCIFLANIATNFWFVAPSFHPDGFALHWLDLVELLTLGGIWFAAFFHFLKQSPPRASKMSPEPQHA
jgi:hypothetical protein